MINLLKKLMNNKNIDGYIIPKNDEFFSEYSYYPLTFLIN